MPGPRFTRRTLIAAGALAAAGGAAVLTLDRMTRVPVRGPGPRQGDPLPAHPGPDDPPFQRAPLAGAFAERRRQFLEWAAARPTPPERGGIWTDLCKLELDRGPVSAAALRDALDFVAAMNDTADFYLAGLLRLYFKHAGTGRLAPDQAEAIRQVCLDFKYWFDEPTATPMEAWTENHQILFFSAEYLAGQLFPDDTFTNNGKTGRQRMAHARPRILRWLDWRARTGFAEWDSVVYYPEDLAALLNLVDFCQDPEISGRAAIMVDMLLFDVAVDSFYGQLGTSQGRAKASTIKSAAGDSLVSTQALLWGLGRFQSANMPVVSLATSDRYRLPAVIESVALDMPAEMTNRERHSIPLTDAAAAQYGLRFDRADDVEIWWAMGAFTHPKVIDLTLRLADEWGLWHYPDFRDFKTLGRTLRRVGLLSAASAWLDPDPNGIVMSEVNKVTFRTPDYMLSCAQDWRKGEKGYQQHIWQATLGPYAVVFVTNPDSLREDDRHRPSYWASNGRFPRAAQHRNVLICLYDLPENKGLLESRHYLFTHAYFPRWAFDRVAEVPAPDGGGWICGQKGGGYVALYSHLPYTWQTEGPDAGQEVMAVGRRNAWICQAGRRATDGSFDDFVAAVTSAPLSVRGLEVDYAAPGVGKVTFSWTGPLQVNGQEVPLSGYPRWDNPYCQAEFGTGRCAISHGGRRLVLDMAAGERRED